MHPVAPLEQSLARLADGEEEAPLATPAAGEAAVSAESAAKEAAEEAALPPTPPPEEGAESLPPLPAATQDRRLQPGPQQDTATARATPTARPSSRSGSQSLSRSRSPWLPAAPEPLLDQDAITEGEEGDEEEAPTPSSPPSSRAISAEGWRPGGLPLQGVPPTPQGVCSGGCRRPTTTWCINCGHWTCRRARRRSSSSPSRAALRAQHIRGHARPGRNASAPSLATRWAPSSVHCGCGCSHSTKRWAQDLTAQRRLLAPLQAVCPVGTHQAWAEEGSFEHCLLQEERLRWSREKAILLTGATGLARLASTAETLDNPPFNDPVPMDLRAVSMVIRSLVWATNVLRAHYSTIEARTAREVEEARP